MVDDFAPEPASLDEIEAALAQAIKADTGPTVQPEPEPAPTEPVEETPAVTDPPLAVEPEVPAEPPAEDLDLELRKAQEAKFEASAKHWEQVAGRHGSEIGLLRKTISDLQARITQPEQDADGGYVDPPAQREPSTAPDALRLWANQQAINAAAAEFAAAHPDAETMHAEVGGYLQASGFDAKALMASSDPLAVQTEARRALGEAYWHARSAKEAARISELQTKKAAQVAGLEAAKKRAAVSATASAPAPRTVQKSVDEMDVKELASALDKETGGKWF
jgi:hypothetical protein